MAHIADTFEVKSVMGFAGDVLGKLMDATEIAGGRNGYDCLRLLTTPKGQATLAQIGGILADARDPDIHKVSVERRISLSDAIDLCNFDEVDPRIREVFSLPMSITVIVENVDIAAINCYGQMGCFGRDTTIEVLKKQGRRSVTLGELLAAARPNGHLNAGATFALGTVSADGFICYADQRFSDWDKQAKCRPLKRSLRMVEVSKLVETIDEIGRRDPNNQSERSWILAVRD